MASEPEIVLEILDRVFATLNVPYVVGGSVASSVYGLPRTTQDIDVMADLKMEQAQELVEKLEKEFYIDLNAVREAIRTKASFNAIHLSLMHKIDVFVAPATPWAQQELTRARRQSLSHDPEAHVFPLSSPEDNILHKLEWYELGRRISDRQWSDILGVLRVQSGALDHAYLGQWAGKLGLATLLETAIKEAGNK